MLLNAVPYFFSTVIQSENNRCCLFPLNYSDMVIRSYDTNTFMLSVFTRKHIWWINIHHTTYDSQRSPRNIYHHVSIIITKPLYKYRHKKAKHYSATKKLAVQTIAANHVNYCSPITCYNTSVSDPISENKVPTTTSCGTANHK